MTYLYGRVQRYGSRSFYAAVNENFVITSADGVYGKPYHISDNRNFGSFIGTTRRTFPNIYVVKKPMFGDLPTNFAVIAGNSR
jgi:hypothetical protein